MDLSSLCIVYFYGILFDSPFASVFYLEKFSFRLRTFFALHSNESHCNGSCSARSQVPSSLKSKGLWTVLLCVGKCLHFHQSFHWFHPGENSLRSRCWKKVFGVALLRNFFVWDRVDWEFMQTLMIFMSSQTGIDFNYNLNPNRLRNLSPVNKPEPKMSKYLRRTSCRTRSLSALNSPSPSFQSICIVLVSFDSFCLV